MRKLTGLKKALLWIGVLFVGSIAAFAGVLFLLVRLVPFQGTQLTEPKPATVIYDREGQKFLTLSSTGMPALTYQQIPQVLQNAVLSTEDHSYWQTSSVDPRGILRAAVADLVTHSYAQGGSTIQEQLAKILYLSDKKTISRKVKQVILGMQLSRYYTKQQILAMYMNRVFLGENAVGMNTAAWRYFGVNLAKDPQSLTLDQAAMLAGMLQAPSAYDPLVHPHTALQRRNQVLQNMVRYGGLSQSKATLAEKQPLVASYHALPGDPWTLHPLFTNFLFDQANRQGISTAELLQGGLKIYTSINPTVQQAVHDVFWNTNLDNIWPGPTSGVVPEGAAIILNPKTGGVLGAAGSRKQGYTRLGLDRVHAYSLPGSSIKPIMDYGPAIQTGKWGPTSILSDTPQNFGGGYTPQNWNSNAPKVCTLQYGLEDSQNVASAWLLNQIGLSTGVQFALRDGIKLTSQDQQHLSIALGGMQHGVTPWQMAGAYEAFDNGGVRMAPHLIDRIVNSHGSVVYAFQPQATTVMSPQTATTMTRLLQDDVVYGIDAVIGVKGWGTTGKSGTQQYSTTGHSTWVRDGWFAGYLPNMVGAAYVGYDNSSPAHHLWWNATHVDPAWNAGMILHTIFTLATQNMQPEQFSQGPYPSWQGTRLAAYHLQQGAISNLKASWDPTSQGVQLSWQSQIPGLNFQIKRTEVPSVAASNSGNTVGTPPSNQTSGIPPGGTSGGTNTTTGTTNSAGSSGTPGSNSSGSNQIGTPTNSSSQPGNAVTQQTVTPSTSPAPGQTSGSLGSGQGHGHPAAGNPTLPANQSAPVVGSGVITNSLTGYPSAPRVILTGLSANSVLLGETTALSFLDTNVQPGITYSYSVQALAPGTNAPMGSPVTVEITVPTTVASSPVTNPTGQSTSASNQP